MFARKVWRSSTGINRRVWQCSERYKVKGVLGCANRHIEESTLEEAFVMAWNEIFKNKEYFLLKWEEQKKCEELLKVYRSKGFQEAIQAGRKIEKVYTDFVLKILDHIKVFEDGVLAVTFLDGTEIEFKSGEV